MELVRSSLPDMYWVFHETHLHPGALLGSTHRKNTSEGWRKHDWAEREIKQLCKRGSRDLGWLFNIVTNDARGLGLCISLYISQLLDYSSHQREVATLVDRTISGEKGTQLWAISSQHFSGRETSLKRESGECTIATSTIIAPLHGYFCFIFHMDIQFSSHYLLERHCFLPLNWLSALVKNQLYG